MFDFIQEIANFRNAGHEFWFYLSWVQLLFYLVLCRLVKHQKPLLFGAACHLFVIIEAITVVLVLKQPSHVFSTDCVWFNGLMAGIYVVLFAALRYRRINKSA